jgi:hypothetical protein
MVTNYAHLLPAGSPVVMPTPVVHVCEIEDVVEILEP